MSLYESAGDLDPHRNREESYPSEKDYREWSEMKAEGYEIETCQEYIDEVRGFNDGPPEDIWPEDDPDYFREEEDWDLEDDYDPYSGQREVWGQE